MKLKLDIYYKNKAKNLNTNLTFYIRLNFNLSKLNIYLNLNRVKKKLFIYNKCEECLFTNITISHLK